MKAFCCLLLAILFISSCKKETATISIHQQLAGKWQYQSSTERNTGFTAMADPEAIEILEFKAGNKFIKITNGEITEQGNYDIIQTLSMTTQKNENTVRFNPQTNPEQKGYVIIITQNKLLLDENVTNGVIMEYSKI